MKKKQYETPEAKVVLSDSEDVVRTSPVTPGGGDINLD